MPVDPHAVLDIDRRSLAASNRGLMTAVFRCGCWPVAASLHQLERAVNQAWREYQRTYVLADRYSKRFGRLVDHDELLAQRLLMRREVARSLYQQRHWCLHLLTDEPAGEA